MGRLFDMDNKLFTALGKIADLIILNIIFLVCCIPVFTIGASITALYTVTLKAVKDEESYIIKSFLKAFKENFKQATPIWLIILVIGIVLGGDIMIFPQLLSGTALFAVRAFFMAMALVLFIMASYVFPIQSKFYNTIKNTLRNSLLMGIRHLPYTVLILVINLIPVIVFIMGGYVFYYGLLAYILVGFSLEAFINSYMFNRIFANYIPSEEDSEEEIGKNESIDGKTSENDSIENKSAEHDSIDQ